MTRREVGIPSTPIWKAFVWQGRACILLSVESDDQPGLNIYTYVYKPWETEIFQRFAQILWFDFFELHLAWKWFPIWKTSYPVQYLTYANFRPLLILYGFIGIELIDMKGLVNIFHDFAPNALTHFQWIMDIITGTYVLVKSTWTEWSMTRSTGQVGLILSGDPPRVWTASRIAAKSTIEGTPLKKMHPNQILFTYRNTNICNLWRLEKCLHFEVEQNIIVITNPYKLEVGRSWFF